MEAYYCPECGEPTDYRPVCTHCAPDPTPYYIIRDWTGKICFHGKTFLAFDDAWDFIWDYHADDIAKDIAETGNDQISQEYYVEMVADVG